MAKTSKTARVMNLLSKNHAAEPASTSADTEPHQPEDTAAVSQTAEQPNSSTQPSSPAPSSAATPLITSMQADSAISHQVMSALEDALGEELGATAVAPPKPTPADPVPAPVAQPEPMPAEPAPEPVAQPEPTPAEPVPVPVAQPEPTPVEPVPAPVAQPEPTTTEPVPAPVAQPEPTPAEPAPEPVAQPEPTPVEPVPAPVAQPEPTPVEPVPAPVAQPEPAPQSPSAPISRFPVDADTAYVNVMEILVEEKADKYIKMFGLCSCPRCVADVKAYALNQLAPKYVVMPHQEVSPRVTLYENRFSTAVTAQIINACNLVMSQPRHTPTP